MITSMRNKSSRTKRGCLVCFAMKAASRPYAYIDLEWIGMIDKQGTVQKVVKEVGICFRHMQQLGDKKIGRWNKAAFNAPYRDEKYYFKCHVHKDECPRDESCPVEERPKHVGQHLGPGVNVPTWW